MGRKPNGYWTYEKTKEEIIKFDNLKMFRDKRSKLYNKILSKGWNDLLFIIPRELTPHSYDKCKIISSKYNHISDFRKNDLIIYKYIKKKKWNELLDNLDTYKITHEKCQHTSSKYNILKDFRIKEKNMYDVIIRNKWKHLLKHMENKSIIWTFDTCKKEALKYKTKTDFKNGSPSAYVKSCFEKWNDEICKHMEIRGNKYKRCLYAFEFDDNHVYIGLTYNLKQRQQNHLRVKSSTVYKYINNVNKNYVLKQLTDYDDVNIIRYREDEIIKEYKENGWIVLNQVKGGNVGGKFIKWDFENCKKISKKYNNLKNFREDYLGAYLRIKRNKWDELLEHMETKNSKIWTSEEETFLFNNINKGVKFCSNYLKRTELSVAGKWFLIKNNKNPS